LRLVPELPQDGGPVDAAGAPGRREDVYRLLGQEARDCGPRHGEVLEVELFVAVLGASSYTYAEATRSQKLGDFIGSCVRTLEYFGGVPQIAVPDQLRSAVKGPDRYDPELNPSYAEFAAHCYVRRHLHDLYSQLRHLGNQR
jgi:transposase